MLFGHFHSGGPIVRRNWFGGVALGEHHRTAFQINEPVGDSKAQTDGETGDRNFNFNRVFKSSFNRGLEILLVFAVFATLTASLPPDVNETHYLTKAKHFWNPAWCSQDLFLSSADAHFLFYFVCGWPTLFLSLANVAWIGRMVCWFFAAVAWVNLNRNAGVRSWFSIISALIFVLLIDRFDMAGEWVIGGFEAKSVAYVFVFWAIDCWLQRRYSTFFWAAGGAVAFHAVVGIWALVGFGFAFAVDWRNRIVNLSTLFTGERRWPDRKMMVAWVAFIALFVIGCVPPIWSNLGQDAESIRIANVIQVHQRLSHHLYFGSFAVSHVARFTTLVVIFLLLSKFVGKAESLIFFMRFANCGLAISLGGLVLSGFAEGPGPLYNFANGLLRYYWFRLADFAVPLAVALSTSLFAGNMLQSTFAMQRRLVWISVASLILAVAAVFANSFDDLRSGADRQSLPDYPDNDLRTEQTYENWLKVCRWIKANTHEDSLFFTPYQYQTFKWHAQRAEYVCWKDMPQDVDSLLHWRQRILISQSIENTILGGVLGLDKGYFQSIVVDNKITHLLIRQADEDTLNDGFESEVCTQLQRIYPLRADEKSTYVVYRVIGEAELR